MQQAVQCLLFLQQRLGVKQLERVEPQHLEAFFRHLEACRYTAVTQQRKLKEAKTFFAWLKEADPIPHEPAAGIVLPPARLPAMQCFYVGEIEQLLTAVDNTRDEALLYLLLHTGITLPELYRLNLDDVVLADPQSVVGRSYLWATGRRDKRRLIQLDDKTVLHWFNGWMSGCERQRRRCLSHRSNSPYLAGKSNMLFSNVENKQA